MKTVGRKHGLKASAMLAVSIGLINTAQAISNWTGAAGDGDMANTANWDSATDMAKQFVTRPTDYEVNLSTDLTIERLVMNAVNHTVTMNLGAERTLAMTTGDFKFNVANSTLRLTSGTLYSKSTILGQQNIAVSNRFIVTGPNSRFYESNSVSIGPAAASNAFEVAGGAFADVSRILLGGGAGTGSSLEVHGEGTRLVITNGFSYVGDRFCDVRARFDDHAWVLASAAEFHVGNNASASNAVLEVANGACLTNANLLVGYHGKNAQLKVDAGSVYANNGFAVGRYADGSGSSVEIVNGGTIDASSGAIGLSTDCNNNSLRVDGEGSRFASAASLLIAQWYGISNVLEVSHGGRVTVASFCQMGGLQSAANGVASDNAIIIRDGGSLAVAGVVTVGGGAVACPSYSNRFEILNGSTATVAAVQLSSTTNASQNLVLVSDNSVLRFLKGTQSFNVGSSNRICITGNSLFELGGTSGSSWQLTGSEGCGSRLEILDGSTMACSNAFDFANSGTHHAMVVDNALFYGAGTLVVGGGGSNNVATVRNGGVIDTLRIRCGSYGGCGGILAISNGTVNVRNEFSWPWNSGTSGSSNNVLSFAGTTAQLVSTNGVTFNFANNTVFHFDLAKTGYAQVPVWTTGQVNISAPAVLEVEAGDFQKVTGGDVVLMQAGGLMNVSDELIAAWNRSLPTGVTIRKSGKQLILNAPFKGGTVLTLGN